MSLMRKQLVLDLEDLEPETQAEIEAAVQETVDAILARTSTHEPDPAAVRGWTPDLAREYEARLRRRGGVVQARTLGYQAHHDGVAPREKVYELGGYPAGRRLNGFTKPSNAVFREMVQEGLLPADAANPVTPVYDHTRRSFQQAQGFTMPKEVAEVFATVLEAPTAG
jgi:hypothetical protein